MIVLTQRRWPCEDKTHPYNSFRTFWLASLSNIHYPLSLEDLGKRRPTASSKRARDKFSPLPTFLCLSLRKYNMDEERGRLCWFAQSPVYKIKNADSFDRIWDRKKFLGYFKLYTKLLSLSNSFFFFFEQSSILNFLILEFS